MSGRMEKNDENKIWKTTEYPINVIAALVPIIVKLSPADNWRYHDVVVCVTE